MGMLQGKTVTAAGPSQPIHNGAEDEDDGRRRNSLAFYISQFVNYEGEDFAPLVDSVMKDKFPKSGGKPPAVRPSSKLRIPW